MRLLSSRRAFFLGCLAVFLAKRPAYGQNSGKNGTNTQFERTKVTVTLQNRPNFVYRILSSEPIDGDTYKVVIDCGFSTYRSLKVRLAGASTPELSEEGGKEATSFAQAWFYARFSAGSEVYIRTRKTSTGRDKRSFSRYVADVYDQEGTYLADALRKAGHA